MSQPLQTSEFASGKRLKLTLPVMAYGVLSILLLPASSIILWSWMQDPEILVPIELGKDLLFVAVTTILLHRLLRFRSGPHRCVKINC